YLAELLARTGQVWQGVFKTHCPPGAWNGVACTSAEDEGVGIYSSLPMSASSSTLLPYADCYHSARAAVRAAIGVGAGTLQVFGTHLQSGSGGCGIDAVQARYNS